MSARSGHASRTESAPRRVAARESARARAGSGVRAVAIAARTRSASQPGSAWTAGHGMPSVPSWIARTRVSAWRRASCGQSEQCRRVGRGDSGYRLLEGEAQENEGARLAVRDQVDAVGHGLGALNEAGQVALEEAGHRAEGHARRRPALDRRAHHRQRRSVQQRGVGPTRAEHPEPHERRHPGDPGRRQRNELGLARRATGRRESHDRLPGEHRRLAGDDARHVGSEALVVPEGHGAPILRRRPDRGEAMRSPERGVPVAVEQPPKHRRLRLAWAGGGALEARIGPPCPHASATDSGTRIMTRTRAGSSATVTA